MKLNVTLIFIIISLLFVTQLSAQTASDNVVEIRQKVQRINNKKKLKTRVLNGEEFLEHTTDGGGELTCYFDQGKLVKIVEWIGLSSCIQITEYDIYNNNLIFAYIQGKEFEYLTASSTTTPKLTMECRFYYVNNKPIKSLFKGSTKCGGAPTENWASNYIEQYTRYKNMHLNP